MSIISFNLRNYPPSSFVISIPLSPGSLFLFHTSVYLSGVRILGHPMDDYMRFELLSHHLPCWLALQQSPKVYMMKLSRVLKWKGVKSLANLQIGLIFSTVLRSTDTESDLNPYLESLKQFRVKSPRTIVYCRSLNVCSELYTYFLYELGEKAYYPDSVDKVSDNCLFGMFHAHTRLY